MKNVSDSKILRVAVQKSGRLSDDSLNLLKRCDLDLEGSRTSSTLKLRVRNMPMEIFFLRDDDIPEYVEDGVADIGIVGANTVEESGREVTILQRLSFGKCRLSLAVPKESDITSVEDLQNSKIATSHPRMLKNYLTSKNIKAQIRELSGSVEIAPGIGLATAICDLVSSGSTLVLNGLRELAPIFLSQAVIVGNESSIVDKAEVLSSILFRIDAVERASRHKYIMLNAADSSLPKILTLFPGLRSPTVVPLAEKGWSSVQIVVQGDDFWGLLQELRAAGAEGILMCNVETMIE